MSYGRRRLRMHRDWDWGKRRVAGGKAAERGRWSASVDLYGLNVPSIVIHGEGDDYAYAAIQYGSAGSDPVLRLEVDLQGTWLGRRICDIAYWWRKEQWRRRDQSAVDPEGS